MHKLIFYSLFYGIMENIVHKMSVKEIFDVAVTIRGSRLDYANIYNESCIQERDVNNF